MVVFMVDILTSNKTAAHGPELSANLRLIVKFTMSGRIRKITPNPHLVVNLL